MKKKFTVIAIMVIFVGACHAQNENASNPKDAERMAITEQKVREICREEIGKQLLPGVIIPWSAKTIPSGWEICDGREVSKDDPKYKALYATIGILWGGNANPNFKLPDLRKSFLRGANVTDDLTNGGGRESHNHGGWTGNARGDAYGIRDGGANPPAATGFGSQHSMESDNHLPPFKTVVYLIKL